VSYATYSVVGAEGTDTLVHVESVRFADETVSLSPSGVDFEGAGLAVHLAMNGTAPSQSVLDNLIDFETLQYNYAVSIGVADPLVHMWEALGQALSGGSTQFSSNIGPMALPENATFVAEAYEAAFGFAPGQPQIDHFVSQVNYFEDLYAGVYPAESATLLARGAVYGQMLGISAELDYLI
jgi:hypothetical protein